MLPMPVWKEMLVQPVPLWQQLPGNTHQPISSAQLIPDEWMSGPHHFKLLSEKGYGQTLHPPVHPEPPVRPPFPGTPEALYLSALFF